MEKALKNNLKTKVMLAVLASGMLCANGAYASFSLSRWYGTTGNKWTCLQFSAEKSNLTLTIGNSTQNDDTSGTKALSGAN